MKDRFAGYRPSMPAEEDAEWWGGMPEGFQMVAYRYVRIDSRRLRWAIDVIRRYNRWLNS